MRRNAVIVGAGIAGLTAARALERAGWQVTVVEGAADVGGRTRSVRVAGELAELGGEWVGRRHVQMGRLIRELQLTLEPAGQIGRPTLWRSARSQSALLPPLPTAERARLLRAFWRLSRMARSIDATEPWLSPRAADHDSQTVDGWLTEQGLGGPARALLDALCGSLASRPTGELSLLHALWWIRRGGGLLPALLSTFEYRIREGAQEVSRRLAGSLESQVRLEAEVSAIEQTASAAAVSTTRGRLEAARVVVTAQPGALRHIAFDPGLPRAQSEIDQLPVGAGTKVVANLAAPPPKHRSVLGGTPLAAAWRAGRRLTGFAPPSQANASDGELLADLAACFGVAEGELVDPIVMRWDAEPLISGCDMGFGPGALTRLGPALRTPHGRVHFAGAERGSWPNNMEGAAESGVRSAGEVALAG